MACSATLSGLLVSVRPGHQTPAPPKARNCCLGYSQLPSEYVLISSGASKLHAGGVMKMVSSPVCLSSWNVWRELIVSLVLGLGIFPSELYVALWCGIQLCWYSLAHFEIHKVFQ